MVILSLTVAKRLVSQENTLTTGWVTDDSITFSCFMMIEEIECCLHGILSLTVTKRLVSQEITVATGCVTDDFTTYSCFMVITT